MQPSIDLDPDMGHVEFIEELELVFGVTLSQIDVGHWLTLNDVHQTIKNAIAPPAEEGLACATSMAFYRIRQALRDIACNAYIKPDTDIASLVSGQPRRAFNRIAQVSGLRMPPTDLTNWGCAAFILLLGSIVLLTGANSLGAPVVSGAALVGIITSLAWIFRFDPGQLPRGIRSVGDLARRTALTNFLLLRNTGARERPGDLWRAIAAVAAENSVIAAEEITPDHFLFRSIARSAEHAKVA